MIWKLSLMPTLINPPCLMKWNSLIMMVLPIIEDKVISFIPPSNFVIPNARILINNSRLKSCYNYQVQEFLSINTSRLKGWIFSNWESMMQEAKPKLFKIEKWYVENIFTINSKWQVVTSCYCWGQKNNLSGRFKFEPIITNHLWFIVKML